MFSKNSRIIFSEIIWLDCEPYGENHYKKKCSNSSKTISLGNLHQIAFILFNVTDPLINSLICICLCYCDEIHDNKEFNCESRPVKLNSSDQLLTVDHIRKGQLLASPTISSITKCNLKPD